MTKANDEFTYTLDVIFGVGTPVQLLCVGNSINNHRKLKSKWRDIRKLEYTDSTMNTKVKLSDDDFEELAALVPFKNHLQNELGLVSKNPVDITQYSCEDFSRYYDNVYDPKNPTQYEQVLAQAAEKHTEEMNILAAGTANAMTTTGSTVTTSNNTNTSGGNSCHNGSQSNAHSAEEKALDRALVLDRDSLKSLKSEIEFSTWLPIFKAEAIKQGFEDLLDSNYTPTVDQKSLFEKRQKVFFSFLSHHLMTTKGKDIVSNHSENFDAQAVWKKLIAYHTTSPKAAAMKQKFLDQITVARIDPTAKLEDKILRLKSLFRAHNSFTATPLTKEQENTYMNRFASQSKDFATGATLTSLVESISHTKLSPEDKMDLTENQATMVNNADEIQNDLVPSNSHRRGVHQTLVQEHGEHIEADLGDGFITVMKMSSSGVSKSSFRVPKDVWIQLSPEDRTAWLSMSKAGRTCIMNPSQHSSPLASAL